MRIRTPCNAARSASEQSLFVQESCGNLCAHLSVLAALFDTSQANIVQQGSSFNKLQIPKTFVPGNSKRPTSHPINVLKIMGYL